MRKTWNYWLLPGLLLISSGCVDGPLYAIKQANPYYRAQWRKDRELGPTFADRVEELELLKHRLPKMSEAERQQWGPTLAGLVTNDKSPEIRTRATTLLGSIPSPVTENALNAASIDENLKVRVAACRSWQLIGGKAARDMLLSLAQKEGEETSVKLAAIESLSQFDEVEVRDSLARLLDDSSPAVQYQVTQSLSVMTGRDYGGDFDAWRQFMAGNDVPESPQTNVATDIWNSMPFVR